MGFMNQFVNNIKTVLLLGLLSGLLLGVGILIGGRTGLIVAFIIAILFNFGSYWFSDKLVLAMYKAKKVSKKDAPKLFSVVEEVAKEAGMPMPSVYQIPSENPNAFATGRNKNHAVVAVTEGILKLLTREELKGVIAHEFAHIKNKDMLISTVAATIATVISYLSSFALFFGGGDEDGNSNFVSLLVLAILTPIIAMFIQLAISRSREYLADESGARFVKDPEALASALEKLEAGAAHVPMRMGSNASSSMFIVNPFSAKGMMSLLSTHPPVKERVRRLRGLRL